MPKEPGERSLEWIEDSTTEKLEEDKAYHDVEIEKLEAKLDFMKGELKQIEIELERRKK